jgi:hypothetical protein
MTSQDRLVGVGGSEGYVFSRRREKSEESHLYLYRDRLETYPSEPPTAFSCETRREPWLDKPRHESAWLEGCLLALDRRAGQGLIAFTDMDLDSPCWLPAAKLCVEFYEGASGWAIFGLPPDLAQRRLERLSRPLAAAAQRPPPRRTRVFLPKKPEPPPAAAPSRQQLELF